ncbi:MAG TPA: 4a-hydroxytetrahydrobiopterin dehydratase [Spirillospora sp.]|nr:4a-hydroxytetrahydrobiopterin dehydratase [Spirillospora sp.]
MTTPLNEVEIAERLQKLDGWERDGDKIKKTFRVDSYLAGLALAAAIGTVCEGLNHHPDMFIGWRKVEVSFTTHDAGNKLSAKDFQAAEKIESLGYPRPS